ncbi:macrophage mannose receptor 1 isoform X1 [Nothobranchius furzeri]|uniref:Transcript variant X1 n=3 Tax=Nothobranchius furzeri TaxID=105023 RepID=A0A9D2Z1C6_NOTFU|nr:transcript variant X1 [Nothobranchius furzeri]
MFTCCRCSGTSSSSQSLMTLDCGGIVGRTVTVFHPDVPLTLCEVEIFSTWNHPGNIFQQRPPTSDCCSSDSCSCDYVFLGKEPMTWSQAQTYCRERYSDLAIVNNPKDMNIIVDNMDKNNLYSFWIGLHENELTWRWSAPEELYYNDTKAEFWNWATGEPNNQMDIPHCVGIEDTGRWRDLDCSLLYCFICFDGQDGAPQAKVFVQTPMRWTDARQYCREEHTDLVGVRTSAENEELQSMVPSGTLVWIGLYGDAWKWSDGQDNLFRYWEKGQPKNSGNGLSCAYVGGGAWTTQPCDTKSSFLCYYYKKRTVVKISTDANLCDPVVKQHIQKQLEARMKNNGISNFKIHWKTSGRQLYSKGQISQCVNPEDGEV